MPPSAEPGRDDAEPWEPSGGGPPDPPTGDAERLPRPWAASGGQSGPPGGGRWGSQPGWWGTSGSYPPPGSTTGSNLPPGDPARTFANTYARTPWDQRRGLAPPSRRRGPDPRTVVWVAIGVAVVAWLIHSHVITSFEILLIAALVPSVILHEVSHGAVALAFGDDTAKRMGRLTLNPVRHVDPFGTIIMPAMLALAGLGPFGYAKPVPVDVSRLRSPRNHSVVVSLAGPAVNIVLALACAFALRTFVPLDTRVHASLASSSVSLSVLPGWAQYVFAAGYVNVILAAFNLIPLPPLDGSAVLERLLPRTLLPSYYRIRPYTMLVLLVVVLLFRGALADVFDPALRWWGGLLT